MTRTPSPETPVSDELIAKLWRLHRRGLSYASDKPAVNLLLADLSEGLKLAAERLTAPTPSADVSSLIERAINLLVSVADPHDVNTPDALVAAANARAAIAAIDTEAAIVLKRYREALATIEEWNAKAKVRLSELQKEMDDAYPEIRKALGPNATFAHTVNSKIVKVRGPLAQIGFAIDAALKAGA